MIVKRLIIFSLTLMLCSCGGGRDEKAEEVEYNIQNFNIDYCIICKDPFQIGKTDVEDSFTNLYSEKNEYGENTDRFDDLLFFDDITLVVPPAGKRYSFFNIPITWYSQNCWTGRTRNTNFYIDLDQELLKKVHPRGWELFLKARNGEKFDLVLHKPRFKYSYPEHACDEFSISLLDYNGIMIVPKEATVNGVSNLEIWKKY